MLLTIISADGGQNTRQFDDRSADRQHSQVHGRLGQRLGRTARSTNRDNCEAQSNIMSAFISQVGSYGRSIANVWLRDLWRPVSASKTSQRHAEWRKACLLRGRNDKAAIQRHHEVACAGDNAGNLREAQSCRTSRHAYVGTGDHRLGGRQHSLGCK